MTMSRMAIVLTQAELCDSGICKIAVRGGCVIQPDSARDGALDRHQIECQALRSGIGNLQESPKRPFSPTHINDSSPCVWQAVLTIRQSFATPHPLSLKPLYAPEYSKLESAFQLLCVTDVKL